MSTPRPTLPAGARLLHVGPHKTGTTALQSALSQARTEMREQGVDYASRKQHDRRAGQWAVGRFSPGTDRKAAKAEWARVAARMTADTDERRIFSSEHLADASEKRIDQIIDELGRDDLWVAVTLRPLAKILPSQYQSGLQRRRVATYGDWLHAVLDPGSTAPAAQRFWVRHRHDELIRRWADRLGTDRVRVTVLDSSDRQFLPRAFEDLLGLDRDTLASKKATENRSLTAAEAELLRRMNVRAQELGLRPGDYLALLTEIKVQMKARQPHADEPRLVLPDWATDRANEIGREIAENIRQLGVPVVGDLDILGAVPASGEAELPPPPSTVDLEIAAWFSGSLALSAVRARSAAATARAKAREARSAAARGTAPASTSGRRSLVRRVRQRLGRRGAQR